MEWDFKETNEKDGSSQSTSQDLISNSQNIEQSFPALSEYYNSLEPHVKRRYLEQISVVGLDPGIRLYARLDPECLLPIEAMDLFSYLVTDTSLRPLKAWKRLIFWYLVLLQMLKESNIGQICRDWKGST